jgi:hypothetical protein
LTWDFALLMRAKAQALASGHQTILEAYIDILEKSAMAARENKREMKEMTKFMVVERDYLDENVNTI